MRDHRTRSSGYDDGRGLTGTQYRSYLRARCLGVIRPEPSRPASLTVTNEVTFESRETAYAFACALMQRADETWGSGR